MTQHHSSFNLMKKKEVKAPPQAKKGELIVERIFNSTMLFFKVQGGGQVPKTLRGGFTSQVAWDKAKNLYLRTVKRPKKEVVLKDTTEVQETKAA